jgi:hypothetical protein
MIIALIETIMMDYTLSCPAGQFWIRMILNSQAINISIYNYGNPELI